MDAAGYVKLQRLFIVSVTGNLIVALASMYKPYYDVLPRVLIVACFLLGVVATTFIIIYTKIVKNFSSRTCAIALNLFKISIIAGALVLGLFYDNEITAATSILNFGVITVGSLLTFAMGIHVATIKEIMPYSPSTAMMTTNVITVVINICVCCHYYMVKHAMITLGRDKHPQHVAVITKRFRQTTRGLLLSTRPLLSFIVGASVGAISAINLSFWCLLIPIATVLLLTADIFMGYRKEGGEVNRPWFDPEPLDFEEEEARENMEELDPELFRSERMSRPPNLMREGSRFDLMAAI